MCPTLGKHPGFDSTLAGHQVSEDELICHGADVLAAEIRQETKACQLTYLVIALAGKSFLLGSLRARRPDDVQRSYDLSVRDLVFDLCSRDPSWKLLFVSPSSWRPAGPQWDALRRTEGWFTWHGPTGFPGTKLGAKVNINLRGFHP